MWGSCVVVDTDEICCVVGASRLFCLGWLFGCLFLFDLLCFELFGGLWVCCVFFELFWCRLMFVWCLLFALVV